MKKIISIILIALVSGCATKDLAKSLRYSNNNPVGVENIKFKELKKMKKGEACIYNLLYFIPLFGDSTIITAAENADINSINLIGESGFWSFPFSKSCTVVYGDLEDNDRIKTK